MIALRVRGVVPTVYAAMIDGEVVLAGNGHFTEFAGVLYEHGNTYEQGSIPVD